MKKHWYFLTILTCPVCGGERIYRERRYGRRPRAWGDRHDLGNDRLGYDGCVG